MLPTLSRLVAPLDDIPRSYLCSCLCLEYQATTAEFSMEDANFACQFKPRIERTDYDVMYAGVDPIPIHCAVCKRDFSFVGRLPLMREGCVGVTCEVCVCWACEE